MEARCETDQEANDTRIVSGACCTWWGSIEEVDHLSTSINGSGRMHSARGMALPCCPHCKGVLYETPSIETWYADVDRFEAAGHTGYRGFVDWLKGKCLPSYKAAIRRYEEETGRRVRM